MGGIGSGRSKGATNAVEELLAAKFRNDRTAVSAQLSLLTIEHAGGRSLMSAEHLDSLTSQVVSHLGWTVHDAVANPRERLGDIRVDTAVGAPFWIEVKAQTMKERFADITQADFIREGTDFLRSYAREEPRFDSAVTGDLREQLGMDVAMLHGARWSLQDLWIADLALLVDDRKKGRAGATDGTGLHDFLRRKYFLQFCKEGARIVRLDDLGPVRDMLAGSTMFTNLKMTNSGNVASIQISAGEQPAHGSTDFTYHVGYRNAPGRHKLHEHAIARSTDLATFTA